jgi:hypothetical protein
MSSSTLTSLAMLKMKVDQGQDYLDYLRPFILQVLVDHRPDPVTDSGVRGLIRSDFGMEIPVRAIQLVLKRLSRECPLKKTDGVYRVMGALSDPGVGVEKARAARHINAILTGLCEFSKSTVKPISSEEEADVAICLFLSQFDIQCLRAYLRGTAIPAIEGGGNAEIVLVSKYVLSIRENDPERFESFLVAVQGGHMLANALLCPDLQSVPKTYHGVTFYLDTPLLVRLLGLEGDAKRDSIKELIDLLTFLGGSVCAFEHSRDELEGVIKGAALHLESLDGRGEIVLEARRQGVTKSDLLIVAGQLDKSLSDSGVGVVGTPPHAVDFQIDEKLFSEILSEEVRYSNQHAKICDIDSVRSIYVLRARKSPKNIEKCGAVLVTCNSAFARAAFRYGERHQESRDVSAVITDFSLANMAWLKAPMSAPAVPMREVIAFSYAALQPSPGMWDKYLLEVEKLEKQNSITASDLQLLRSSQLSQGELMNLTLGDEAALGEQTITQVLSRVTEEIRRDDLSKLSAERVAHEQTRDELKVERDKKLKLIKRLHLRCNRRAGYCAWAVSIGLFAVVLVGLLFSFGVGFEGGCVECGCSVDFACLFCVRCAQCIIWIDYSGGL